MTTISLNNIEDINIEMDSAIKTAEVVMPKGTLEHEQVIFPSFIGITHLIQLFMERGGSNSIWRTFFNTAGTHGLVYALNAFDEGSLKDAKWAIEYELLSEHMVLFLSFFTFSIPTPTISLSFSAWSSCVDLLQRLRRQRSSGNRSA